MGLRYAAGQLVSEKLQYGSPVGRPDMSDSKDQSPGRMIETPSLNTSNSTRKRRPDCHQKRGWEFRLGSVGIMRNWAFAYAR